MREERNYWQRRLTRRGVIRTSGITAVGASTAALIGCGGDDDDEPSGSGNTPTGGTSSSNTPGSSGSPSVGEPKPGGTLTSPMATQPRSLDFHFDTFVPISVHTNNALLKFNRDLTEIQPDAAVGLPEQPDPLTYTFKIQPGIKFHNVEPVNGRELTAEDVKYSIERQMTDEAGKYQHAFFFRGKIDKIEATDTHTVTFKMVKPYAPFVSFIANPWTLITAPEIVNQFGDLTQVSIRTGPFLFKEWQKDVRMDFVKNPDYFKSGRPYIDNLTYIVTPDPDTASTLFIEKKLDLIGATATQLQRLKDGRKDAKFEAQPQQGMQIFRMPPTMPDMPYAKPYDDPRVREAVVRAINKKQVYDLVYRGEAISATGPVPPAYTEWALKDDPAGFDLKKAKELMDAAGLDGFTEKFIWASASPATDQAAEIYKRQLAEIGVNLELNPMETAAYYNLVYTYKYGMSQHATTSTPDPDEALGAYYGRNSTYYKFDGSKNGIWDKIDAQSQELDTAKRKVLVDEVQKQIVAEYPVSFNYALLVQQFTDPRVQNWFFSKDAYNVRVEDLWLSS